MPTISPGLFANDPDLRTRAEDLAARTHELMEFLVDVMGMQAVSAQCNAVATYHDSCSGLREMGVREQPRRLLGSVAGLELREMVDPDVCCGFGGTFCVKYPDISTRMVSDKVGPCDGHRSRSVAGRRHGLPAQHGRPAVPPRQPGGRPARRRRCWQT